MKKCVINMACAHEVYDQHGMRAHEEVYDQHGMRAHEVNDQYDMRELYAPRRLW